MADENSECLEWTIFKTHFPELLTATKISNLINKYSSWSRPLTDAVKGCLQLLAKELHQEFIPDRSNNSKEFLADGIICRQESLGIDNLRNDRRQKQPVCFPIGDILYAVEWEWDTGRDAAHFATRDIPKLRYIRAEKKMIIYGCEKNELDKSRNTILHVLKATSLVEENYLTIIELARNNDYCHDSSNRILMTLLDKNLQEVETVPVFPKSPSPLVPQGTAGLRGGQTPSN